MANKCISTLIWEDDKWCETLTDIRVRYLWLYLLTNNHSKSCGVYRLPKSVILFETRLEKEEVEEFLNFLAENQMCEYSAKTQEIAIYNMPKYNIRNSGKPVLDMLRKELDSVKDRRLIEKVYKQLKVYADSIVETTKHNQLDTICNVYLEYINNNTYNNTNTNNNTNNDTSNVSLDDTWENLVKNF